MDEGYCRCVPIPQLGVPARYTPFGRRPGCGQTRSFAQCRLNVRFAPQKRGRAAESVDGSNVPFADELQSADWSRCLIAPSASALRLVAGDVAPDNSSAV